MIICTSDIIVCFLRVTWIVKKYYDNFLLFQLPAPVTPVSDPRLVTRDQDSLVTNNHSAEETAAGESRLISGNQGRKQSRKPKKSQQFVHL